MKEETEIAIMAALAVGEGGIQRWLQQQQKAWSS